MQIDFNSKYHNSTKRDYLARVNNKKYPKHKAATLAKKWGFDYWDGDRDICYGGYKYIPNRWNETIKKIIKHYRLSKHSKILDIGCGKGYFLYDFKKILPNCEVHGLDISQYAIKNSKKEI